MTICIKTNEGGDMELLERLERLVTETWQKAIKAGGHEEKQRLMQTYRHLYEQYRRQKQWLTAMGEKV